MLMYLKHKNGEKATKKKANLSRARKKGLQLNRKYDKIYSILVTQDDLNNGGKYG